MANTAQARKRARQAEKHRALNTTHRSMLRTSIRKVIKAIASGDVNQAKAAYQAAVPIIDRMAKKNIIHGNKAARHKSHLNQHIRKMGA